MTSTLISCNGDNMSSLSRLVSRCEPNNTGGQEMQVATNVQCGIKTAYFCGEPLTLCCVLLTVLSGGVPLSAAEDESSHFKVTRRFSRS